MSTTRKSYTNDFKKQIVIESRGKVLKTFCAEKHLDERMVRKWRSKFEQLCILEEYGHGKKRSCGSGRVAPYPELETLLYDWIIDRRLLSLIVRRTDIQKFALVIAAELDIPSDKFKASKHWLDNFMNRHHLSLRKSTSLFKLTDDEIVKRTLSYKSFIDNIDFSQYQLSHMVSMDETAVYMGENSQTTIEQRGASSIYVPSTGYESARVTCILAIRLDGTKVTPMLISKGAKDNVQNISGVYVIETSKAWATQEVIRKWIVKTLPLLLRGKARGLLVWDSASTHRAVAMKRFLGKQRIDQVMIPAGTTGYLQSLDIAVNKPFKDYLRQEINDYIEHRMTKNQRGNFVKPSLQEVVSWVRKAWEKISTDTISNALRASYLDKRYSFKESSIAKHERLGPLIQQALQSQQNVSNVDGSTGSIYDDIPEADEVDVVTE